MTKVRAIGLGALVLLAMPAFPEDAGIDGVWQGDIMPATRPMAADLGFRNAEGWFCVSLSLSKKQASFAFPKATKEYTATLEKVTGGYRIRSGGRVIALLGEPKPMFGKIFARIKREKGGEVETIGMDIMKRPEATATQCVAALAAK